MIRTILGFFGGGIGAYVAVGLGAAVLLLAGAVALKDWQVSNRDREIGAKDVQITQAVQANGRLAQAFDLFAAEYGRTEKFITVYAAAREARAASVQKVIQEVYRDRIVEVPAGCPAASPVLLDGLERLRRLKAGAADPGAPGAARPGSRSLAALPAGPGNP